MFARWSTTVSYSQLLIETKKKYPKFVVRQKKESILMKIISWILFLITFGQNKREVFMNGFITTVGYAMYVPDGWENKTDPTKAITLVHEREHMRQKKKYGLVIMALGYIFWPFPIGFANFRLMREIEANSVEIVFAHKKYGFPLWDFAKSSGFKQTVDVLTSASYFWPSFNKEKVARLLKKQIIKELNKWQTEQD